jgi:hypothetical protein
MHTAENIAEGASTLENYSNASHPKLGESWTIGKDVFGDGWSSEF